MFLFIFCLVFSEFRGTQTQTSKPYPSNERSRVICTTGFLGDYCHSTSTPKQYSYCARPISINETDGTCEKVKEKLKYDIENGWVKKIKSDGTVEVFNGGVVDHLFDGVYTNKNNQLQRTNLMIRLSDSDNPSVPVFVSMIAFYGNMKSLEQRTISYRSKGEDHVIQQIPENGLLFENNQQPVLIDHFNITISSSADGDVLTEIEVYKPAMLGDRSYFSPPKPSNWSTARTLCHSKGASLASNSKEYKYPIKDEKRWMGFVKMVGHEMLWDNGDYNYFTSHFTRYKDGRKIARGKDVTTWQTSDTHFKPLCMMLDVVYYLTQTKGTSSHILEQCSKGGGIPVSPNSEYERALLLSLFPNESLRVAGCIQDVAVENFYNNGSLDCNDTKLALSTNNVLVRSELMLKGACKKFVGNGKRIEIESLGTGFPGQQRITDKDVKTSFSRVCRTSETFNVVVPLFRKVERVHKLRILMSYNKTSMMSKDFLYIQLQCNNSKNGTSKDSYMLVPLSKAHRYQYHTKILDLDCANFSLSWTCKQEIAEIQFLEKYQDKPYITADTLHLDLTRGLELKCTVEATSAVLAWYRRSDYNSNAELLNITDTITGLYKEGENITSSIRINSTADLGLYHCKDTMNGIISLEAKIIQQRYCLINDTLTDLRHGTILSEDKVPAYSSLNYTCNEGYTQTQTVNCELGGVFQANIDTLCQASGIFALEKLCGLIESENFTPTAISDQLYTILANNDLAKLEDKHMTVITDILRNVTQSSYNEHKVLLTVIKSVGKLLSTSYNTQLISLVDDIGQNTKLGTESSIKLAGGSVAVMIADVKQATTDVTFAVFSNQSYEAEDLNLYTWSVDTSAASGSIQLPKEWRSPPDRIWFTVLQNTTLPAPNNSIIGTLIMGANVDNLKDFGGGTAVLVLQKLQPGVDTRCVYWDGVEWSSEGVEVISDTQTHVTCKTTHLTSFAVLMTPDDSFVPAYHKYVLDFVSTGGSVLSCVCLLLTIICLSAFKHIREPTSTKIHIHLSVALFCSIIIFLFFIDKVESPTVCVAGAILLHYFLLVSMAWMMCEAVHMYLTFVVIFTNRNHVLIMAGFAWGIPLLVVFFALARGLDKYRNSTICWLTPESMYFWFAPPVIIIALVNSVFFVLILKAVASALPRKQRIQGTAEMRSCVAIMTLLGCTWAFGFFTLFTKIVIFQYLFAISNSLQGFFIFFFYCGTRPDVINAWKKLLCRGGSRFESTTSSFKSTPTSTKPSSCPITSRQCPVPSFTVPRAPGRRTEDVLSVVDCEEDNF